jgi:hypothetical protein
VNYRTSILVWLSLCLALAAGAQVTNNVMASADAFVCTGSANYQSGADLTGLNFGDAGTLAIAPANSAKGEFRSVLRFNLANLVSQLDTNFGPGQWTITGLTLKFTSNYGVGGVQPNNPIFNTISGGQFVIEWLSDDRWVEGSGNPSQPTTDGITYAELPAYLVAPHVPLCTNTYLPPGNNVPVYWPLPLQTNLVADIRAGGSVSFYFYAADAQVAYLFNSYKYGRGNEPYLQVVASSLPVTLQLCSGVFTNGVFRLTGLAGTKAACQLQVNTNLATTNWVTLTSLSADTNGLVQFDDASATNAARFYRLTQ